ncbi:MAG: hypothetical protein B7Y39_02445 [Bdellovibrio sp. 28-41-41]|nr:MAG: hypothetical protein B7Y39_02445 [Bdellovibrio sp. 28-41-41]
MKNYFKYVAVIALLTVGVACENKSSNSEPQAVAAAADPSADQLGLGAAAAAVAAQAMIAPSGGAVTTSTVVAHESNVGETPASSENMSWDEIIAAYPALADRVNFLAGIDKVVETDARTFDLYSGGSIVLTLEFTAANDALVVKNSAHAGFAADLISVESIAAEQTQGKVVDRLDFVMSSCDIKKEEPQQEQEQAQTGKEAPAKEEPTKVEEPKQEQEQAQTGKEAPVKEEPAKVEEPKQECASIVASLVLEQVVVKQEQEQKETPVKQEAKQEAPVQQEQK